MHALVHTHAHANAHMYTQMKGSGEITSSELYMTVYSFSSDLLFHYCLSFQIPF